ncbi:MAG TPA: indole-3-glycerol phosphate synthase TrpC [Desulfobacterales bacterium]|nr:indole-3-glycerol phosphate synthase TrpC [Desulfobacterales bacterium]
MKDFLERIVAAKLQENARLRETTSLKDLRSRWERRPEVLSLKAALDQALFPAIIAEIKKASPSKGVLRPDLDHVDLACAYQTAGAAGISVLTERQFFQGSPDFLAELRPLIGIPLLRKDFILEPVQVYESAALGADALLLIAACLPPGALRALLLLTESLGMQALVEVFSAAEMQLALEVGATLIGINHRNLHTFEVDMNRALELAPLAPADVTLVAASGLNCRADLERFRGSGIRAFLIGETLVRAPDPGEKLRELLGDNR